MDKLDEVSRWILLDRHCGKPAVVGRSDLEAANIKEIGLELDPNWIPEHHVDLVGWPAIEEEQVNVAQALYAAQACLLRSA